MAVINGRTSSGTDCSLDIRDPACAIPASLSTVASVRGACPSLEAPMMTGDGLLVRLRPGNPSLHIDQVRRLAAAATAYGNGLIEVTARGSLQLRGLRNETIPLLAADIDTAGIVPETGLVIETPPLSSLDPTEIADARVMASRLKEAIASLMPAPVLAPKLSVIIDGGTRVGLAAVSADIRLMAVQAHRQDACWHVAVAGDSQTACRLTVLRSHDAIAAVIMILKRLSEIGPRARGRDLDAAELKTLFATQPEIAFDDRRSHVASPIGIHDLGGGRMAFGVRLPYAQIRSGKLIAFLDRIERLGISELRLAPGHGFILLGIRPETLEDTKLAAANSSLMTTSDDPRNQIHACAGKGGCASAFYDTKGVAAKIAGAPDLFDGSAAIHVSGCSKGCAHPGRTALTLVGTPMGYGLVVNGSASNEPAAYIQPKELESALAVLRRLVDQHKGAGESIDACLKRLGGDAIAKALDRDRNA